MKRGHSNVYVERIERYPTSKEVAKLPLYGGATVQTCKELPPLAMDKEDWEKIGRYMGWLPPKLATFADGEG